MINTTGTSPKRFQILNSLPTSGPMYVCVSKNNEQFYNEGFTVRFFKNDGTDWVGNFKTIDGNLSTVCELSGNDKFIVIAGGQGYIMSSDDTKPLATLGGNISAIMQTQDNRFIATVDTGLLIINPDCSMWESDRISWDDIKDLKLHNNIITGLSFDPFNDNKEWVEFTLNIDTKEITGGSYPRHRGNNNCKKKPFWKFW